MNPLLILGEDNIVYRLNPSAVFNTDDIIQKIANQKFASVDNYAHFDVAVGAKRGELSYSRHPFNLSLSHNGDLIYWSHIPGLVFDTKFSLVEHSGSQTRIIPDLDNINQDSVPDKLFWSADVQNSFSPNDASLKILFAVTLAHKPPVNRRTTHVNSRGNAMKCYLMFQLFDKNDKRLIGNFLPCLPNIFGDSRICMGHSFEVGIIEDNKENCESNIQRAIKWFFESRMNQDLIDSEIERAPIAASIFGWDCNKNQVKSLVPINEKTFVKRVGNYYIDGLPT